ncbi:MAG: hypothetical protein VB066_05270 [Paludibacter sp.]|nr:hypothetical protein [Paludibacter sp.]
MKTNILICYPSWEDRSFLGISRFILENDCNIVYLIKHKKTRNHEKTSSIITQIEQLLDKHNIVISEIHISSDGIETWQSIENSMMTIDKSVNVTLDITTMSRNVIWSLLTFLKKNKNKVTFFYNQPEKYSDDWISREPYNPKLLFKHSGIIKLGKPTILLILSGFDVERTKQLLNYYEPQKIVLGIQVGTQFCNDQRNSLAAHRDVCHLLGYLDVESFNYDSYSEDFGFNEINTSIKKYIDNSNIIATSLGPKLSAISLYKSYLQNQDIALCYIPCKEYNLDYCSGIGKMFSGTLIF